MTSDTAPRALRNFVGGDHVEPADGRTADVVDPSTGRAYAQAPVSSAADVDRAMTAAAEAFEALRSTTRLFWEVGAFTNLRLLACIPW